MKNVFLIFSLILISYSQKIGITNLIELVEVEEFEKYVVEGKEIGVEMIIFPELAIRQKRYEEIVENTNPCKEKNGKENPIQHFLSCLAKEKEMYIVFDLVENGEFCNTTESFCFKNHYLYNTGVVFDRKGNTLVKYRKTHPFMPKKFKPGSGKPVIFDTDFDMKFGIIICFDILFKNPILDILNQGVKNLLFPTFWVDKNVPALATQIQQGVSLLYDINIFAANDMYISSGSGIWEAGKPLNVTQKTQNKLLVAEIGQKMRAREKNKNLRIKRLEKLKWEEIETKTIQTNQKQIDVVVETSTFSCSIKGKLKQDSKENEFFQIIAARKNDALDVSFDECLVFNCGNSLGNCELTNNTKTESFFEYLSIELKYQKKVTDFALPLLSTENYMVFDSIDFDFRRLKDDNSFIIDYKNEMNEPFLFGSVFAFYENNHHKPN